MKEFEVAELIKKNFPDHSQHGIRVWWRVSSGVVNVICKCGKQLEITILKSV